MGSKYCMPRNILYFIYILQLISTAERQLFDFLGYMWLPILANFLNIIFVIFGIFGLYQYLIVYLILYIIWSVIWIAFNVFIVCYYLSVGDLNADDDLLSFGTGSFSWWLINTPGCDPPQYNTSNLILSPEFNPLHPLRPSHVEGCLMNYENVEVTHAGIQLVLSAVGLCLATYMVYFVVKVVNPKREKQGLKAMYSIEYSPHRGHDNSNPNTLERETDLHEMEAGEARAHMTPRRVKRRSYRNSGRSAKSISRQQHRSSGHKSARSSARSHKSINPVTRLIDADQNRADSSTSNDYGHITGSELPSYGQINPGFTGDQSRPNSIYNLSGPPTDVEASRPQSTLTSYSNFHHQRKFPGGVSNVPGGPGAGGQPGRGAGGGNTAGVTNLTQESLMNHENNLGMNSSYDDLPPPPPPLSSSPSPPQARVDSDSDNTSSVVTAQMPVPQLRSSIRRNEYVNIPVQPKDPSSEQAIMSHQSPEPQQPGPRTSSLQQNSSNYVNYPQTSSSSSNPQQFNGARPRTTNPLYKPQHNGNDGPPLPLPVHNNNKTYINDYTEVERSQSRPEQIVPDYETRISYEAETLRADTKLTMPPPYYNDPYSLSDNPSSQRSSQAEPSYPPAPPQRGYLPVPSRDSDSDGRFYQDQSSAGANPSLPAPNGYHHQNDSTSVKPRTGFPPVGQHTNETDSMGPEFNSHHNSNSQDQRSGPASMPVQPSEAAMRRIPSGGRSRDRASLRQRQRRDMEAKASKQPPVSKSVHNGHNDYPSYVNTTHNGDRENDYGFSGQQIQHQLNNGKANGYADMSGIKSPGSGNQDTGGLDDKWYLKDSMRPVGSNQHGQTCKCYRCQRKLTAI